MIIPILQIKTLRLSKSVHIISHETKLWTQRFHLWKPDRSGVRRAGKCSPGRMEAATCKGRHFPSLSPAAPRVLWLEAGLPGSPALRACSRRMDSIWSEGQHALSRPEGYAGLSLLPGGCGPWKVPASLGETPVPFSGEEACDFTKPRCPVCEMHPPMRWHHWPAGSPALVLLHLSGDDYFFTVNKGQGSRFYGWWKDSALKHFSKEPIKDCIFVLPACWSICSGTHDKVTKYHVG